MKVVRFEDIKNCAECHVEITEKNSTRRVMTSEGTRLCDECYEKRQSGITEEDEPYRHFSETIMDNPYRKRLSLFNNVRLKLNRQEFPFDKTKMLEKIADCEFKFEKVFYHKQNILEIETRYLLAFRQVQIPSGRKESLRASRSAERRCWRRETTSRALVLRRRSLECGPFPHTNCHNVA